MDIDRETLGREVRRVWIEFCLENGDTKPSHLASWEEMTEPEREVDRRIGEAIARMVLVGIESSDCQHEDYEQIDTIWDDGDRACWICHCMVCGQDFEQIVTVEGGDE